MIEIATVFLAMVWLALGGYAFGRLPEQPGESANAKIVAFLFCLMLGPALFGVWLAGRGKP